MANQKKFLDQNGVLYVWTKLKTLLGGKVDKEFKTGSQSQYKVLSDNNLTDELVTKINNAGDSSFSGNYGDLKSKPSINGHELASGENSLETLGIQAAGDYATKAELGNKVSKEDGKGLSTEDYTTAEKTKLGGIQTGAQVNVIESVKVNGIAQEADGKAVNIAVPTKVSQLSNDSKFQTETEVTSKVNNAVADKVNQTQMTSAISAATTDMATKTYVTQQLANINKKAVVTSTEEMTDPNTIYLMANVGEQDNSYDEYIVYDGTPEKIGTTKVDLTNYVQDSDLIAITNGEIDEIFKK